MKEADDCQPPNQRNPSRKLNRMKYMKIPDKKDFIIIVLVIAGIAQVFFSIENHEVTEAYRLEKESAQRHTKHQIDSMNHVAIRKDEQLLKLMRELAGANMETQAAKQEANNYRIKYENIKITVRSTDLERADALRRLYPN